MFKDIPFLAPFRRTFAEKLHVMQQNENRQLPECLAKIAGQVRQYCELQQISEQLSTVLRVPSIGETATHMAVRLAAEREIQGRMDYLENSIALAVVEEFNSCGMLSKYPELHTNRSGR